VKTEHRFIYIAHPIDFQVEGSPDLVPYAKSALAAVGLGSYDPMPGWYVGKLSPGPEIERVNHHALSVCTGVLVIVWSGTPSIGVWREIEKARLGWAMPVAVVTQGADRSWSLADGHVEVFDVDRSGGRTLAVNAAVRWLKAQEAGVTPFDRGTPRKRPLPYVGAPDALVRSYPDDAGLDIVVAEDCVIQPGEYADIPSLVTGIELPEGTWGMITGRSSTLRNRGLLVSTAVIDVGWRGPLFCGVQNIGNGPEYVEDGARIAQLILIHNATESYEPRLVETLSPHDRGTNGFGSTGR
jgi:dUTP pyrophosphatase